MYDAIVVGARCAGASTAMLLARKGYRVLLVDRASFPSDTLSTHSIHHAGIAKLQDWGLLEQLVATGCPPVNRYMLDVGDLRVIGSPPPAANGVADAYCPRRTVLDKILVDAAVAAGVELRENFSVQSLVIEGDRVTGIIGHTKGGTPVVEKAQIVIGADGKNSLVAQLVEAPIYNAVPALASWHYAYWSDFSVKDLEVYKRDKRAVVLFPTHDDLTVVGVAWPTPEFRAFRADVENNFHTTLDIVPEIADRMANSRRETAFLGVQGLKNFFRKPYGPGWALVGDSGYSKDPDGGQGITDAFIDAENVAEAIAAGLSGAQPILGALAEYEQKRNQRAMPMYQMVCEMASLQPVAPPMLELFKALQNNPEESDRFMGALAGTVSIPEFFAPENLQRIIGMAQPMAMAA